MSHAFLLCVTVVGGFALSKEPLADSSSIRSVAPSLHGYMRGTGSRAPVAAAGASSTEGGHPQADHNGDSCGLMLIAFFVTRMQDRSHTPTFDNMSVFYESAMAKGVNVTVLYDELPVDILMTANERFQFVQMSPADYDVPDTIHGMRYSLTESLIRSHPEWQYVFLVDLFKTQVAGNPCADVADDSLYVAIEPNPIQLYASESSALSTQFRGMGGKYQQWWQGASPTGTWKTFSDGIVGGYRDVMLTFTEEMMRVLTDPDINDEKIREDVNVNAAAFNYLVQVVLKPRMNVKKGRPVHFCYWGFEAARTLGPPEHECYMSERVGEHAGFWFAYNG